MRIVTQLLPCSKDVSLRLNGGGNRGRPGRLRPKWREEVGEYEIVMVSIYSTCRYSN